MTKQEYNNICKGLGDFQCIECFPKTSLTQDISRGAKENEGKADVSMVSWELIEGLARVRMYGREKYTRITQKDARNNWKKGIPFNEAIAAAIRHLFKAKDLEKNDPESGLSHLLHAIASIEHAYYTELYYPQLDDREDKVKNNLEF